jgi:hypothetical protein
MFLKSEGLASSIIASDRALTLASYCAEAGVKYADVGEPVALETFTSYGLWFQELAVPEILRVEVEEIRRNGEGFELTLKDGGRVRADQVAIATGIRPFAHIPPELRELPSGMRSHTVEHHDLATFAGKRVLVVGAGQAALESAVLIQEAGGQATIVTRRPRIVWNPPPAVASQTLYRRLRHPPAPLGPGWPLWAYSNLAWAFPALPGPLRRHRARHVLGPAGAWWLRSRVAGIRLLRGRRIARSEVADGAVRLALDGPEGIEEVEADHVLAATGYRVDLGRLSVLDPELRALIDTSHGAPLLSRRFESSVPGLFFTGIAAVNQFGPLMRFVCGAEFAARRLATAATAQRRTRGSLGRRPAPNVAERSG